MCHKKVYIVMNIGFFLIHLCIILKNDKIYTINISLLRMLYTVKIKKNCLKSYNLILKKLAKQPPSAVFPWPSGSAAFGGSEKMNSFGGGKKNE